MLFNFAGSQVLRLQIENGAPADVFISADPGHVQSLKAAGLLERYRIIATNELVLIVPRSSRKAPADFQSLPQAESIVLGAPNVPIGQYARAVIRKGNKRFGKDFEQQVLMRVVSEESNVRLLRSRVELGAAQAALVYRTDAMRRDQLRMVEIPEEINVTTAYYGGRLKASTNTSLAEAFLDHLRSPEGLSIFAALGFLDPGEK